MTILRPELHESEYQKALKTEVETALQELGLNNYTVRLDPRENRADLFVINDTGREILVIEVKKTKQDVLSPRYWNQARKYVLNSTNWNPTSPKVFSVTNGEELCVFCLREDFTHIKYCLLKNGKISIGNYGANGEADDVLAKFREKIKQVIKVCLGMVLIEYDENWFPILEKFRIELDALSQELVTSVNRSLASDANFNRNFTDWSKLLYPYYDEDNRKNKVAHDVAGAMLFKALSYEVIRDLIRNVPLKQINNVRLEPITRAINHNLIDRLSQLYTDIVRIDYTKLFETDLVSETVSLSQAGKTSLKTFLTALSTIPRARGETADSDFVIESLVHTIIPPDERHESGLTIEDKSLCDLLANICINKHCDRVVDIAAGTCAILGGAYDRIKKLRIIEGEDPSHRKIMEQITAIESNEFVAKVGALRFILKNLLEQTDFNLLIKDSFNVTPNADMDVLLCNPPYLRQADIPSDYKEMMRQEIVRGYRAQGIRGDFPYSTGQADKYFYFVEWGLLFLKPGGMAGLILSDKFLDSKNGLRLKKFLLEQTNLKGIIKYTGKYFEDFDVTTCVVIAQKKSNRTTNNPNLTRFIRLHQEATPERVQELLNSQEGLNVADARVVVERRDELDPDEKWGKKLLGLPKTYEDCLSKPFMKKIGDVLGRGKRGKDNGCNTFFFPTSTKFGKGKKEKDDDFRNRKERYEETVKELIENIEGEFLKKALNSADLPKHYTLQTSDVNKELLLVVPRATRLADYPGLKEFIRFAERTYNDSEGEERAKLDGQLKKIPERPTIMGRRPWYSLYPANHKEDTYALIIPRMHRATFKVLIPQIKTFFSTNFVGFGDCETTEKEDVKFLAGFLMSSLGQLMFEERGDWREGLLKIEAGEMYKMLVPDPSMIENGKKQTVVQKFQDLKFGLNGLERPGPTNPRFELDKTIMKLFYADNECEEKAIEIEECLYQTVLERDPKNKTR